MVMLKRCWLVALLGALVLGVFAPPALADGEKDSEVEEAWRQALDWVAKAKELKADGQVDKAKALMAKADQLKQAVKEHKARLEAKREHDELMEKAEYYLEKGEAEKAEAMKRKAMAVREKVTGKAKKRAAKNREAELKMTLHDLECGARVLRKLGKTELADSVIKVAHGVAKQLRELRQGVTAEKKEAKAKKKAAKKKGGKSKEERGAKERRMAEKHIEIIKVGVGVLVRADQHRAAEQLEQAAHAIELQLEGRRDDEAREIIKSGPGFGQMTELLMFAAKHAAEQSAHKQAGWLKELSQHYRKRWERNRKQGKGEKAERIEQQRRMKERHPVPDDELGLLRQAVVGLAEANRHEAAERVEQAEHWRRLWAEGHRGPDAQDIRRSAPAAKELAKLLRTAADLWASWHHPAMGEALDRYAQELSPRGERAKRDKRTELLERLERLEMQLKELREAARR